MTNATMETFGFPRTLLRQFDQWVLLLRPAQVTLGSLVLVSTSQATEFSALPPDAYAELGTIIPWVEATLRDFVDYEKINYLMLMMVDPHVHFHVVPRYSDNRSWGGLDFPDQGWPGPPDLKSAVLLNPDQQALLRDAMAQSFV